MTADPVQFHVSTTETTAQAVATRLQIEGHSTIIVGTQMNNGTVVTPTIETGETTINGTTVTPTIETEEIVIVTIVETTAIHATPEEETTIATSEKTGTPKMTGTIEAEATTVPSVNPEMTVATTVATAVEPSTTVGTGQLADPQVDQFALAIKKWPTDEPLICRIGTRAPQRSSTQTSTTTERKVPNTPNKTAIGMEEILPKLPRQIPVNRLKEKVVAHLHPMAIAPKLQPRTTAL